ncbi:MAG: TIGR02391 family protein [Deltaproteobacteria bacterium]|nr:TIGR02391 family protein [Deltaproteobacteria bacterium]
MNLETLLDQRLWQAIDNCYTNRNYTGCIIDAIHYLGNLLRKKTGLQSDGVVLVGESLGGKSPKLKVNKLETESDINEQKGIEQILRGIYQAIRNPRSHEKHIDDKMDAVAIIIFLNYLIKIIDKSKSLFTMESFLERVFEPDFVEKERYAELLIDEIPIKTRFEVFVEVFRKITTGEGKKLRLFFYAISKVLNDEEIKQAIEIISEELKCTNDDQVVRIVLQCFPAEWWNRYSEVSRLRIENKLIQSIRDGSYDIKRSKCLGGSLGTWSRNIFRYF